MSGRKILAGRSSRRQFLKVAGGGCALGLAVFFGCSPIAEEVTPPEDGAATQQHGFVRPVRAGWFSKVGQAGVKCELCPRECQLMDGERGACRVRENREGVLYTLAFGNPALAQEDPVERKPFFHVLPGSRALSISTAGCNLDCKFCEVWDMALVAPEEIHTYDMPPEKVVAHAQASGVRSVSYAFGEPVIFYEYMMKTATLAKEAGLLNLIHTAGYIQPEPLLELCGKLDGANVDLKSFEPEFYREVVGGELKPVLKTLMLLREAGVHLEITYLVIPTLNDDLNKVNEMCKWVIKELGADVPLHFARFYPLYKLSALPRTPVSTLDQVRNTALEAGLKFVYVAKVSGHAGENTYCPGCAKTIIKRLGFVIEELHLKNGACSNCGTPIPGRWS